MARTSKKNRESDDRIAHSVQESPAVTPNRARREGRAGSGNLRQGQAQAIRQVGARSSSKTGPDRTRNRSAGRARANKRPSKR